jgi:hypothetical protein
MNSSKCVSIGLAVCSVIFGLIAAFYWYQSSIVKPDPGWSVENPEPVVPEIKHMVWNSAILTAVTTAADLSKIAAIWTALSVALGGAASIVGSLA